MTRQSSPRRPTSVISPARRHRPAVISGVMVGLSILLAALIQPTGEAYADSANARPANAERSGDEPTFRWPGEEFYFSIRLNGAEAMRAGIRAGEMRNHNNRAYVPISATAQSMGFFHTFYPLQDRVHTFIDPTRYRPLRSEKEFDEKGQLRTYRVDYRHSIYEAQVHRTRQDHDSRFKAPIPGTTHDMLSWMYEFRAHEKLELGQTMSYYIYDGWLLSRLDLKVVGKEDIYTPMGWFKAWKIDFSREIMRSKAGPRDKDTGHPSEPIVRVRTPAKHTGSFWVSRDENHLPIKVTIQTLLGVGEAVLIRYTPARRP